jgi:hypothetical protein
MASKVRKKKNKAIRERRKIRESVAKAMNNRGHDLLSRALAGDVNAAVELSKGLGIL